MSKRFRASHSAVHIVVVLLALGAMGVSARFFPVYGWADVLNVSIFIFPLFYSGETLIRRHFVWRRAVERE